MNRASVWRTVSCNAVLNLRHVHFLFYATLNIVDIDKFAHKIISVTFFSGTTEASFLIFGTEHQYGELYRVTQFWICDMSTSCLTRLWIFKRKEVGRRHMSSLEDLLLSIILWFVSHVIVAQCPDGYTGKLCTKTCAYPFYGQACQKRCLCSKKRCNSASGCISTKRYTGNIAANP